MKKIAAIVFSIPLVVVAQTPSNPPKEILPEQAPINYPHIPFDEHLNALKTGEIVVNTEPVIVVDRKPAGSTQTTPKSKTIPAAFKAGEVELSQTARAALSRSAPWMTRLNAPTLGDNGRVLYTYGKGLPEVVCAPLRICTVELQAGEKIIGEPQIGDSVRWLIQPASAGTGDAETEMVVIKPTESGLDTNLILPTDRRVYYIRLVSRSNEYMARVAFTYPEDQRVAWQQHIARQKQTEAQRIANINTYDIESLNFDYTITVDKGTDSSFKPTRVFDDGKKTIIQMPAGNQHRELPALLLVGSDGKSTEMVNFRVHDNTFIIDRLFDHAVLLLDVGRQQRRVTIKAGSTQAQTRGFFSTHHQSDEYQSFPASGENSF